MTPTASTSPSPTPTSTLDAKQQAAVAAVEGYIRVSNRVGADPSKYSQTQMVKAFRRYTGGDMVKANVTYFMSLKNKDYHYAGPILIQSVKASRVVDNHNARGLETQITTCLDQTQATTVTRSGKPAPDESDDPFNLRQFSVLKPVGQSVWRVYGMETVKGECGP